MDYSYLNSGGGPAACNFDSMSAAAAAAAAADSFVYGDMGNPYRCYGPRYACLRSLRHSAIFLFLLSLPYNQASVSPEKNIEHKEVLRVP